MENTKGTLPISDAQKRHLSQLIQQQAIAKQATDAFVAYLKDEHGVGPEWTEIDAAIGFVKGKAAG